MEEITLTPVILWNLPCYLCARWQRL